MSEKGDQAVRYPLVRRWNAFLPSARALSFFYLIGLSCAIALFPLFRMAPIGSYKPIVLKQLNNTRDIQMRRRELDCQVKDYDPTQHAHLMAVDITPISKHSSIITVSRRQVLKGIPAVTGALILGCGGGRPDTNDMNAIVQLINMAFKLTQYFLKDEMGGDLVVNNGGASTLNLEVLLDLFEGDASQNTGKNVDGGVIEPQIAPGKKTVIWGGLKPQEEGAHFAEAAAAGSKRRTLTAIVK